MGTFVFLSARGRKVLKLNSWGKVSQDFAWVVVAKLTLVGVTMK